MINKEEEERNLYSNRWELFIFIFLFFFSSSSFHFSLAHTLNVTAHLLACFYSKTLVNTSVQGVVGKRLRYPFRYNASGESPLFQSRAQSLDGRNTYRAAMFTTAYRRITDFAKFRTRSLVFQISNCFLFLILSLFFNHFSKKWLQLFE